MIVAREKPLSEILSLLEGVNRVLVVGCGQCTALCQSGGRKEVEHLVSLLQAAGEERGVPYRLSSALVARQCDPRYLDSLDRLLDEAEACLS
ncbi:MAG: hypothetical protein QJR13_05590, partial [Bacillota bacterium]|nr:hypothetical protein [Bacillota bacterium]